MAKAGEMKPWQPSICVILDELKMPNPYTGEILKAKTLQRATRLSAHFVFCCMAVDEIILKMVTKA